MQEKITKRLCASAHAVDRLRQRVSELEHASVPAVHRILSGMYYGGVALGGQLGRDELVSATCDVTGEPMVLAVTRTANGSIVIKTVLTGDQATVNAQVFGWAGLLESDDDADRQPRSWRDCERSSHRRRRRHERKFSAGDEQPTQGREVKSKRKPPSRQDSRTTRELLAATDPK